MAPLDESVAIDFLQWIHDMQIDEEDEERLPFSFSAEPNRHGAHSFSEDPDSREATPYLQPLDANPHESMFRLLTNHAGTQMWIQYLRECDRLNVLWHNMPAILIRAYLDNGRRLPEYPSLSLHLQTRYNVMRMTQFSLHSSSLPRRPGICRISCEDFSELILHPQTARQDNGYVSRIAIELENASIDSDSIYQITFPRATTRFGSDLHLFLNSNCLIGSWLHALVRECDWFQGIDSISFMVTWMNGSFCNYLQLRTEEDPEDANLLYTSWGQLLQQLRNRFSVSDCVFDVCVEWANGTRPNWFSVMLSEVD